MWDKLSDYCLDISKYFLTAMFVTSLMTDLGEERWALYVVSGIGGGVLLCLGLYFDRKSKKRKKNIRQFNRKRKYNNNKNEEG